MDQGSQQAPSAAYDEEVTIRDGGKPARLRLDNGTVSLRQEDIQLFSIPAQQFNAIESEGTILDSGAHIRWDITVDGQTIPISFYRRSSSRDAYGSLANRDKFIALMQPYQPIGLPASPTKGPLDANKIALEQQKSSRLATITLTLFALLFVGGVLLYAVSIFMKP